MTTSQVARYFHLCFLGKSFSILNKVIVAIVYSLRSFGSCHRKIVSYEFKIPNNIQFTTKVFELWLKYLKYVPRSRFMLIGQQLLLLFINGVPFEEFATCDKPNFTPYSCQFRQEKQKQTSPNKQSIFAIIQPLMGIDRWTSLNTPAIGSGNES